MSMPKTPARIRPVVGAIVMGLALLAQVVAEEPPKPPDTPELANAVRRGWVRARIISGRIYFTGARLGNMPDPGKSGDRDERLSITMAGRELHINYRMSTSDEELLIEVIGGGQVHICRTPKGDSSLVPVDFRQAEDEPLCLSLGSPGQERVCRAPSLWHLLVMEPEASRQHLLPLLALLNPQPDLDRTAQQAEAALVRGAAQRELPDPQRWSALVEQLGDERFSRREAADRQLRALGRVVLTYLERLDPSRLDAEQHYRVRRIIKQLSSGVGDDSPLEIADWLAGDPAVWFALLSRDDESTRRSAAERLEAFLGRALPFDPSADATTRSEQIERLRGRILKEQ